MSSIIDSLRLGGIWDTECWRAIKPGEEISPLDPVRMVFSRRRNRFEPRRLVWHDRTHNVWTAEGINHALNVIFHNATQIETWYCLIFETDTTPADGTTYATPVFTESTAYDEETRPAYVEAESSAKSTTNSANKAAFTISDTKTIYGAALVGGGTDADTKGDTEGGGTLAVAGKFSSSRAVLDDDVINLTYTVTGADDAV